MARGKLSHHAERHDLHYRRAKREHYGSRAVYKLEELDRTFRLIKSGMRVLDLGCWPGSWLQYLAERVGDSGRVVGVDLRPVEIALPQWVTTIVGDAESMQPDELDGPYDVVLSDMAPHTSGDKHTDQWRSEELFLRALQLANQLLRPGGHFAGKVFQGGRFPHLIAATRQRFQEVKPFHTKATRIQSREQYLVGRGMKQSPKTMP